MRRSISILALWALSGCVLAGCAPSFQMRLRSRAASDLSCPESDTTVAETTVGGWSARGCGVSTTYVCSHGQVCVRESAVTTASGDTESYVARAGAWTCRVSETDAAGSRAISAALTGRAPSVARCDASRIRLEVHPSDGVLVVQGANGSLDCMETALGGLTLVEASGALAHCWVADPS